MRHYPFGSMEWKFILNCFEFNYHSFQKRFQENNNLFNLKLTTGNLGRYASMQPIDKKYFTIR